MLVWDTQEFSYTLYYLIAMLTRHSVYYYAFSRHEETSVKSV